jgi:hypothetical protein
MERIVPLVVYVDGERQIIGSARIDSRGAVHAAFSSRETADRLGFLPTSSWSLGPAPEENVARDVDKMRRRSQVFYRNTNKPRENY